MTIHRKCGSLPSLKNSEYLVQRSTHSPRQHSAEVLHLMVSTLSIVPDAKVKFFLTLGSVGLLLLFDGPL